MLFFLRKYMVYHVEELHNLDNKSEFLPNLSYQGILKGFAELNAASGKLPSMFFIACFCAAFCEEDLAILVKNDGPGADTDIIDTFFHGGIINPFQDGVYNHLAIEGIF